MSDRLSPRLTDLPPYADMTNSEVHLYHVYDPRPEVVVAATSDMKRKYPDVVEVLIRSGHARGGGQTAREKAADFIVLYGLNAVDAALRFVATCDEYRSHHSG
jgi:hypothetical protein